MQFTHSIWHIIHVHLCPVEVYNHSTLHPAPATKLGTTIEFPPPPQPPPPPPPPLPLRFDDVARLFDWGRRRLLGTGSFAHVYAATCVAGVAYGPSGPGHVLQEGVAGPGVG